MLRHIESSASARVGLDPWTFILLLGVSEILASLLSYVLPRFAGIDDFFLRSLYYVEWVHVLLFANCLYLIIRTEGIDVAPLCRRLAWPLGLATAATIVLFLAVTPQFRVLQDETNLIGSSWSLYVDRTYRSISEGYFCYDRFLPLRTFVDNRPVLFPFLLMLLHTMLGYGAFHGFYLNFAASVSTLALVSVGGARLLDGRYGLFVAGLLLGTPVFALGATSSGFDVLNQLLLLAVFWQCLRFLTTPTSLRFELLLLTTVFASEARYESIALFLSVAVVGLSRFRRTPWNVGSLRILLVPLLLVPLNWQKLVTRADNFDTPPEVFSLSFVPDHAVKLGRFLFDPAAEGYPSAPLITALAVVGLVLAVGKRLKRASPSAERLWALSIAVGTVAIVGTHLAYYLGDLTSLPLQRLAIAYSGLIAALAAYPLWLLARRFSAPLATVVVAALVLNGLARAGINDQGRQLQLYRDYKTTLEFLRKYPREGTVIISDRPGMFAVHEYGSLSFDRVNQDIEALRSGMTRKLFRNVFVKQRVLYDAPNTPEPSLNSAFRTEPVMEFQNDSDHYIRISRVLPAGPEQDGRAP